jgi:hypothetical protein
MHKHTNTLLTLILAFFLFATPAHAWESVRSGQKSFERAWQAFTSLQQDTATMYFKKAATFYEKALSADPPSRTARFASTLTMAGMSFYYAGQQDACINAMGMASGKNGKIWETYLFTGLSHARQGDKIKTIEFLNHYLDSRPSQRILSNSVSRQIESMETDFTSLNEAVTQIEKAITLQYIDNINHTNSRSSNPSIERCSGPYWWRKYKAPCSQTGYGLNSM